jgi:hypothetical protein
VGVALTARAKNHLNLAALARLGNAKKRACLSSPIWNPSHCLFVRSPPPNLACLKFKFKFRKLVNCCPTCS